jgi:hypothetical protein
MLGDNKTSPTASCGWRPSADGFCNRLFRVVVRRYMSPESLAKARLEVIEGEAVEEVRSELVAAS